MDEKYLKTETIFEHIFSNLVKGVLNRNHEYHYGIFSSLNNSRPSSRIVILRNVNKKDGCLIFHTDYRSPKVSEIRQNNKCEMLFYSNLMKEQLRIKVLSKVEKDTPGTKIAWEKTKLMSRKCYLTSIAPSTEVDKASDGIPIDFKGRDPSKNESELGYKNFAIVLNFIESIEWLSLSSQGHKRISFNWINGKIISKWKIP